MNSSMSLQHLGQLSLEDLSSPLNERKPEQDQFTKAPSQELNGAGMNSDPGWRASRNGGGTPNSQSSNTSRRTHSAGKRRPPPPPPPGGKLKPTNSASSFGEGLGSLAKLQEENASLAQNNQALAQKLLELRTELANASDGGNGARVKELESAVRESESQVTQLKDLVSYIRAEAALNEAKGAERDALAEELEATQDQVKMLESQIQRLSSQQALPTNGSPLNSMSLDISPVKNKKAELSREELEQAIKKHRDAWTLEAQQHLEEEIRKWEQGQGPAQKKWREEIEQEVKEKFEALLREKDRAVEEERQRAEEAWQSLQNNSTEKTMLNLSMEEKEAQFSQELDKKERAHVEMRDYLEQRISAFEVEIEENKRAQKLYIEGKDSLEKDVKAMKEENKNLQEQLEYWRTDKLAEIEAQCNQVLENREKELLAAMEESDAAWRQKYDKLSKSEQELRSHALNPGPTQEVAKEHYTKLLEDKDNEMKSREKLWKIKEEEIKEQLAEKADAAKQETVKQYKALITEQQAGFNLEKALLEEQVRQLENSLAQTKQTEAPSRVDDFGQQSAEEVAQRYQALLDAKTKMIEDLKKSWEQKEKEYSEELDNYRGTKTAEELHAYYRSMLAEKDDAAEKRNKVWESTAKGYEKRIKDLADRLGQYNITPSQEQELLDRVKEVERHLEAEREHMASQLQEIRKQHCEALSRAEGTRSDWEAERARELADEMEAVARAREGLLHQEYQLKLEDQVRCHQKEIRDAEERLKVELQVQEEKMRNQHEQQLKATKVDSDILIDAKQAELEDARSKIKDLKIKSKKEKEDALNHSQGLIGQLKAQVDILQQRKENGMKALHQDEINLLKQESQNLANTLQAEVDEAQEKVEEIKKKHKNEIEILKNQTQTMLEKKYAKMEAASRQKEEKMKAQHESELQAVQDMAESQISKLEADLSEARQTEKALKEEHTKEMNSLQKDFQDYTTMLQAQIDQAQDQGNAEEADELKEIVNKMNAEQEKLTAYAQDLEAQLGESNCKIALTNLVKAFRLAQRLPLLQFFRRWNRHLAQPTNNTQSQGSSVNSAVLSAKDVRLREDSKDGKQKPSLELPPPVSYRRAFRDSSLSPRDSSSLSPREGLVTAPQNQKYSFTSSSRDISPLSMSRGSLNDDITKFVDTPRNPVHIQQKNPLLPNLNLNQLQGEEIVQPPPGLQFAANKSPHGSMSQIRESPTAEAGISAFDQADLELSNRNIETVKSEDSTPRSAGPPSRNSTIGLSPVSYAAVSSPRSSLKGDPRFTTLPYQFGEADSPIISPRRKNATFFEQQDFQERCLLQALAKVSGVELAVKHRSLLYVFQKLGGQ